MESRVFTYNLMTNLTFFMISLKTLNTTTLYRDLVHKSLRRGGVIKVAKIQSIFVAVSCTFTFLNLWFNDWFNDELF